MPAPEVSVVLPVRDDLEGLRRCLEGLSKARPDHDVEVVVALNDATPSVKALAAHHAKTVTVAARGPYLARNLGVEASTGSAIAFLDADTVPDQHWIRNGLRALEDSPVIAGSVEQELSTSPGVFERYDAVMHLRQEEHAAAGFAATANLWVTREAWDRVGPFDARLHSGGDLDWGRRATAHGLRPVYRADVLVRHRTRRTGLAVARAQFRIAQGWCDLVERPWAPWRDEAMTTPLGWVNDRAGLDRNDRTLAVPHGVAMAARWAGWLSAAAQARIRSAYHQ